MRLVVGSTGRSCPRPSIHSVELVRGGASDLYGSSAIGGVISIVPVRPDANRFQLSTSYGSEATSDNSALGMLKLGKWSGLLSGQVIATDGYILVAPNLRGPIDQPNNVHGQNALTEFDRGLSHAGRIFLRGSVLNEDRHNGTPVQINSTRLWRYAGERTGATWWCASMATLSTTRRRSPASTPPDRRDFDPHREDPADELGAAGHWHQPVGTHLLLLAGADTHDVRAADYETLFTRVKGYSTPPPGSVRAESMARCFSRPQLGLSALRRRVDHFSNFDASQYKTAHRPAPLPRLNQTVFDPRMGVTRRLTKALALSASAFRAYRAPTKMSFTEPAGRSANHAPQPQSAFRARHRLGDRCSCRSAVDWVDRPGQLLLDPDQSADYGSDSEHHPHQLAADAREPGPDRKPRRIARLRRPAGELVGC